MSAGLPAVVRLPDLLAEPEVARGLMARVPRGIPVRLRGGEDVVPTPAFADALMRAAAAARVPSVTVQPETRDGWLEAAHRHHVALA